MKKNHRMVLTAETEEFEGVYFEKQYEMEDDTTIEQEIAKLEMDVQNVIRLRYFEELTLEEISKVTGWNVNTVKSKLYRGLKKMKDNIQEDVTMSKMIDSMDIWGCKCGLRF